MSAITVFGGGGVGGGGKCKITGGVSAYVGAEIIRYDTICYFNMRSKADAISAASEPAPSTPSSQTHHANE